MTGTSPFQNGSMHSPSLHSSSYLPRLEANFWSNLRCCDTGFSDLHELLQHYEDVHQQAPSTFPHRMSHPSSGRFRRKSSFLNGANQGQIANNQQRGFYPSTEFDSNRSGQHLQDGVGKPFGTPGLSAVPDMDTIGEMEMDYEQDGSNGLGQGTPFNNQRPPPINSNLANAMNVQSGNTSSTVPTPTTARQTNPSNPMMSSMNTPSFAANTPHQQRPNQVLPDGLNSSNNRRDVQMPANSSMYNPHVLSSLNNDMSALDFSAARHGNGADMIDLCINDPARALFSDGGVIDPAQSMHFGFVNGAATNPDDPAGAMPSPHTVAARALLPGEEERPFKCKVIGCEKAYKNANGLRYHEKVRSILFSPFLPLQNSINSPSPRSTATHRNLSAKTLMAPSPSLIPTQTSPTRAPSAWKRRSPTVATFAASATRTSTGSSTIVTIPRHVTQNCRTSGM